jgi:N-formylglutamate amidohydrolase
VHESVTDCFEYHAGESPLLISIPHDGRVLPPAIAERMTACGREIPDTDWHVVRLYEFAQNLGFGVIAANYSRYVVDLNRSPVDHALYDNQFVTGLCPQQTFSGEDIYLPGKSVGDDEREARITKYWRPYHEKIASSLNAIKDQFGYALLWDAHSIPSNVPRLFDGELPQLNFGTNSGRSCASDLIEPVMAEATASGNYSVIQDGRFNGGYITRHYGDPANGVHAIQLELAQRCYMSEESLKFDDKLASQLVKLLSKVLQAYLAGSAPQSKRQT